MRIWTNKIWCDLTDREISLIDKCADYDRYLILITGSIGYNPTQIFSDLPRMGESWLRSQGLMPKVPDDYNFWFGIFDDVWGYGVNFFYPKTTKIQKGQKIVVLHSPVINLVPKIKWYHGLPDLVVFKCQPVVWDWLLKRGVYLAPRREVKRLRRKIKGIYHTSVDDFAWEQHPEFASFYRK